MAYYNLEPFGAWRDNWHAAMLLALQVNQKRGPGVPAISAEEFMFKDTATEKRDQIRKMMARFNALAQPTDTH